MEEVLFTAANAENSKNVNPQGATGNSIKNYAGPSDGAVSSELPADAENIKILARNSVAECEDQHLPDKNFHNVLSRAQELSSALPVVLAGIVSAYPIAHELPWTAHFRGFMSALGGLLQVKN